MSTLLAVLVVVSALISLGFNLNDTPSRSSRRVHLAIQTLFGVATLVVAVIVLV